MAMTWVWTGMVVLSLLFGLMNGTLDTVASAAMDGAQSAVELSISMAGILCLWSGVMEVMRVCGLSDGLARAFRPLLRRLMPQASRDSETLAAVSANLSANFLGLGNAATPLGIQAAVRSASGAQSPFDILPAVWVSSILSVCAGLLMARLLAAVGRRRP